MYNEQYRHSNVRCGFSFLFYLWRGNNEKMSEMQWINRWWIGNMSDLPYRIRRKAIGRNLFFHNITSTTGFVLLITGGVLFIGGLIFGLISGATNCPYCGSLLFRNYGNHCAYCGKKYRWSEVLTINIREEDTMCIFLSFVSNHSIILYNHFYDDWKK